MKYSLCLVFAVLVSSMTHFAVSEAKKKSTDNENVSKKYEEDFEFIDEDDKSNQQIKPSIAERKKWIHDPSNDLCKPLNCKKKELCLLEDAYTAVCVSKKELHKNKDEVLSKNKYLEDEARRKAEAVEREQNLQRKTNAAAAAAAKTNAGETPEAQDDEIFYDSDAEKQPEDNCKPCPSVKPIFLCGSDNKTYSSLCRLDYHNCLHAAQIKIACKGFCPCPDSSLDQSKRQQQRKPDRPNEPKFKKTMTADIISDDNKKDKEDSKKARTNRMNSKYTFTPEDIKYENKHYKYIKFTANDRETSETSAASLDMQQAMMSGDRRKVHGYNEVLDKQPPMKPIKSVNRMRSAECKQQQLTAIGNRLLDWFSVIMADNKKRRQHVKKSKARFPASCKPEAKWMFGHLDSSNDGYLSLQELYDLEHDQNERCIKPFIDRCDSDQNSAVSPREWCRCFEKADRPCIAVRRRLNSDLLGSYAPDCDSQGFYRPVQCHSSVGVCWCVDKHGVEFANTRTRDKPNCDEIINNAAAAGVTTEDDDDEEADDDESSEEGSADRLLVF